MRSENKDLDNNGIPDPLEIGKAALERQKADSDAQLRHMDTILKYQNEDKKMDLERERMAHDQELQTQKDESCRIS